MRQKAKTELSENDYLELLHEVAGADNPGPEWLTERRIADMSGITINAAAYRLRKLVHGGVLERRNFRIVTPYGRLAVVAHYRWLGKKKSKKWTPES